jgi:hypothetical protein
MGKLRKEEEDMTNKKEDDRDVNRWKNGERMKEFE